MRGGGREGRERGRPERSQRTFLTPEHTRFTVWNHLHEFFLSPSPWRCSSAPVAPPAAPARSTASAECDRNGLDAASAGSTYVGRTRTANL